MIIPHDRLALLAAGCAEARAEVEGLFFDRMPPAQRAHYGTSEGFVIRARCQAGIRLRFRSDTRRLAAVMRFGRAARNYPCLDVAADGIFQGTVAGTPGKEPCRLVLFEAATAASRAFDLWLPYSMESWLVSLETEGDSPVEPLPPEPVTWLVIGDSISQGMTCTSPSRTFAALAAGALGWNHHNLAVGGARMEAGAADVEGLPADLATVAFGCNDWNGCKTVAQFEADSRALLDRLFRCRPELPTALLTPFPAVWATGETNKAGVELEAFREVLRAVAPAYPHVTLIEGPALIPAKQEAFADGIHPSNAGMAVLARNLAPRLAELAG